MTIIDPATVQPSTNEQQWRDDQKCFWERQILVAKCLNWITGFATIAGIVAAGVAGYGIFILQATLDETKKAVEISGKSFDSSLQTFKQQQRAYLAIGDDALAFVYGPLKPKRPIRVNIRYGNFGISPATNIIVHKGIIIANDGIKKVTKLEIPRDSPASGLLPPGAHGIGTTAEFPGLTAEQWVMFMQGDAIPHNIHIIVHGTISYKDIFSDGHETEFCLRYLTGGLWQYCPDHNHMN